jgi:hypothetical protein
MHMASKDEEIAAPGVEALISYLSGDSPVNRRFVAPGVEINTGRYAEYRVKVRNARPFQPRLGLHSHGFVLERRPSRVRDFFDKAEVDAVYAAEAAEIVRQMTGATRVVAMGWMIRTSGDLSKFERASSGYTHQGGVQPPAAEAHVDFAPDRAARLAQALYVRAVPGGSGFRRFIATSLWRAFSEPPQDWPLALCDGTSVEPAEGVNNTLIVVDRLPTPEAATGPWAGEEQLPAASVFRFNPQHRWWYFPDMTRDEVLLFKFHDSDHSTAWRTPHTAFHDTSRPDARVRESIELRSVAYFE